MAPSLPTHNLAYHLLGHAISAPQFSLTYLSRSIQDTDFRHLLLGKFGPYNSFASRISLWMQALSVTGASRTTLWVRISTILFSACRSSFARRVLQIVLAAARPQMSGVATGGVVTSMANKGPVRDWPNRDHIGCPMCHIILTCQHEMPIPRTRFPGHPRPTPIWSGRLIYARPQLLLER